MPVRQVLILNIHLADEVKHLLKVTRPHTPTPLGARTLTPGSGFRDCNASFPACERFRKSTLVVRYGLGVDICGRYSN